MYKMCCMMHGSPEILGILLNVVGKTLRFRQLMDKGTSWSCPTFVSHWIRLFYKHIPHMLNQAYGIPTLGKVCSFAEIKQIVAVPHMATRG